MSPQQDQHIHESQKPSQAQYKVVVSNLNYRTTWKSLKDHMKTAGEVLTAHVLFMGGRPSGRGVIVYKHKEDALRAVETLDRSVLDGRCIIVRSSGQRKFTFEGCVYTSTSTSVTHSSSSGGNHRRIQNDKKPNSRVSTSNSGTSSNESHPTACRHVVVADLVAKPSPMPAADITSRCPQNATPTISGGTEHVGMSGGDVGGPFTEQHQTTLTEQRTQPNNDPTGDSTQNSTSLSEASHIMHETECGRLNRTVYVRNLSYRTTWQGLKDHMRQAGSIAFTDVFIDRRTRRSLGSGIVRYNSSRSVRVALQTLNGSVLDGRSIHIFANTSE